LAESGLLRLPAGKHSTLLHHRHNLVRSSFKHRKRYTRWMSYTAKDWRTKSM